MAWTTPADWDYKEAPGSEKLNEQIRDNLSYLKASLPAGVMMDYGGATAPAQWLICDGSASSRITYADLFTAIGTAYGVGNGSTTFNIPDRRGRVSVGRDASDSSFNSMGETGGAKTVSIAHVHSGPSHRHYVSGTTYSENQGATTIQSGSGSACARQAHDHTMSIYTDYAGTGNTGAMSANSSPSVLQPYLVSNVIIKY